ncbi:hypothetical protein Glove_501g17 [Diversispora epigaea]|uniref:Protein kinase domain-containing protein n=1 Tax=Diversispora epigaea TaxID=1348612 RepID=A0A397GLA2_9GLOM|nr:hypothetical protein Glove_501g17 [Diversispora epigaea]
MKIFLNEIKIYSRTAEASIRFYGITKDPETHKENLRNYLNNNFNNISLYNKLGFFKMIVSNFSSLHELDIVHKDFHPENILSPNFKKNSYLRISD